MKKYEIVAETGLRTNGLYCPDFKSSSRAYLHDFVSIASFSHFITENGRLLTITEVAGAIRKGNRVFVVLMEDDEEEIPEKTIDNSRSKFEILDI